MKSVDHVLDEIRVFAQRNRISPSGLAKRVGMGPNALSNMNAPDWNPKAETIRALQDYIDRQSEAE